MNKITAALATALLASAYGNASALTVTLDSFVVTKNSNTSFFVDDFEDGLPPPSSPVVFGSGPATYQYIKGTMSESNGRLTIDNTGAGGVNALGEARDTARATLKTNISTDPADIAQGIKSDDRFVMTGVFDLASGLLNGDVYGIRFVDRKASGSATGTNDFVQLGVQQTAAGTFLRFYEQDYAAHTITTLEELALSDIMPAGADQIALALSRDDLGSNDILAHFAFLSGGSIIGGGDFGMAGSIFDGENFTRAEFYVGSGVGVTEVPEPGSDMLLALGLIGLVWTGRRRSR